MKRGQIEKKERNDRNKGQKERIERR